MTAKIFLYFCLLSLGNCRIVTKNDPIKCIVYREGEGTRSEYCEGEDQTEDDKPVEYFCHTVWTNETGSDHPSEMTVLRQECLSNLGDAHAVCRDRRSCEDDTWGRTGENAQILHCCCNTDNCNEIFNWLPPEPEQKPGNSSVPLMASKPVSTWFLLLYTLVPLFVLLVVAAALFYVYQRRKNPQFGQLSPSSDQPACPPTPALTCRPDPASSQSSLSRTQTRPSSTFSSLVSSDPPVSSMS